ncbi:MAG: adenine phosphoribosyltransferase [Ruminococcaceae bacterium]|nr:adenine phosphoribosyltransferase [Oscillospiraceae bacterium]
MNRYYKLHVAGVERDLTICPVTEELYIAGFLLTGDASLSEACARELLKKAPEYDYILTAEAKGIPLAHEMARQHGDAKYVVARKKAKAYMSGVFEVDVTSITTKGEQKLYLDTVEAEMMKGKRILIADDVISTGESLRALEVLVEKAGGNIVGKMFVLAEGDAAERDDVIFLEKLPLFDKNGNILA